MPIWKVTLLNHITELVCSLSRRNIVETGYMRGQSLLVASVWTTRLLGLLWGCGLGLTYVPHTPALVGLRLMLGVITGWPVAAALGAYPGILC